MSWWIAFGPQEPGWYRRIGGGASSSGVDTSHRRSIPSAVVNKVVVAHHVEKQALIGLQHLTDHVRVAHGELHARMFCAGSFPRKWSIWKIWSSAKISCSLAFSDTALAKSVPNGFSMTIRDRGTSSASRSRWTANKAALGGTLR